METEKGMDSENKNRLQVLSRAIIIFSILLPGMVGIGVKLWLMSRHKPTWPFWSLLNPGFLALFFAASAVYALPFYLLTLYSKMLYEGKLKLSFSCEETVFITGLAFFAGLPAAITMFIDMFQKFDPIVFLVSGLFIWHYGLFILAGALSGTLLVLLRRKLKSRNNLKGS